MGVACFDWAAAGWFLGRADLQRCRAVPHQSSCLLQNVPKCSWGARSSRIHSVLQFWLRALSVTSWALRAFPELPGAPSCPFTFLWLMGAWAGAWLLPLSPGSACPPSSVTRHGPGQSAGGALGSAVLWIPAPARQSQEDVVLCGAGEWEMLMHAGDSGPCQQWGLQGRELPCRCCGCSWCSGCSCSSHVRCAPVPWLSGSVHEPQSSAPLPKLWPAPWVPVCWLGLEGRAEFI